MLILVLNSGSSSLKYQLFNTNTERAIAKGVADKIGLADSCVEHTVYLELETSLGIEHRKKKDTIECTLQNSRDALAMVIKLLTHPDLGVIHDLSEISAVGHRIVHGGDLFSEAVELTPENLRELAKLNPLAPLHNPPALLGVQACLDVMPDVPNVGVFDTAFHQTMPPEAFMYPISYEMYEKHSIRRYGFHGTSHAYVCGQVIGLLNKPAEETRIITCHIGNGSSLAAIKGGKVVDTSMGFTPHEGLLMGTRCGDIDATAVLYLMKHEGFDPERMDHMLNKESGLLGVSGVSSDFRELDEAIAQGNQDAKLARDIFIYRVKKYIGSYIAAMNGVDAIVFTAGIGENGPDVREEICADMDYLGIAIDAEKNNVRGKEVNISAEGSRVQVWIVPTNEELAIAEETIEAAFGN